MKLRTKEPFSYFKKYLTNPMFAIRIVPDWSFPEIFFFQLGTSFILGLMASLLSGHSLHAFFFPLSSIVITLVGAVFFYFSLSFLFKKDFDFLKVYMIVFLSHLPFLFLRVIKFWVSPIELIGCAAAIILLTVGFVENFELPKRKLILFSCSIYAIYFLIWVGNHLYTQKMTLDIKTKLQNQELEDF